LGKKEDSGSPFSERPEGIRTLDQLEQVRVLADPLRVRILEAFCEEALTTKQVAEQLGEKPTRLYHHVEALEKVGLIKLAGTRPNRGTVEKYYVAIARAFRADASIFSGSPESVDAEVDAMRSMVSTIMQRTGEELETLIDAGDAASLEKEGVLSFVEINASEKVVSEVLSEIHGLIERLAKTADGESGEGQRRYRLTLAYYPLDRNADS